MLQWKVLCCYMKTCYDWQIPNVFTQKHTEWKEGSKKTEKWENRKVCEVVGDCVFECEQENTQSWRHRLMICDLNVCISRFCICGSFCTDLSKWTCQNRLKQLLPVKLREQSFLSCLCLPSSCNVCLWVSLLRQTGTWNWCDRGCETGWTESE